MAESVCEWCGKVLGPDDNHDWTDFAYEGEVESFLVHRSCETEMWAELKRTGELPIPEFSAAGREWARQEAKEQGKP